MPKQTMVKIVFASILLGFSWITHSNEHGNNIYSVQVGAYKTVNDHLLQQLKAYGEVKTEVSNQLTRVLVGELTSSQQAALLATKLQEQGFHEAFVKRMDTTQHNNDDDHIHVNASHRHDKKLDSLSAEDRAQAVYLDGKLHLKKGEEFIPVQ